MKRAVVTALRQPTSARRMATVLVQGLTKAKAYALSRWKCCTRLLSKIEGLLRLSSCIQRYFDRTWLTQPRFKKLVLTSVRLSELFNFKIEKALKILEPFGVMALPPPKPLLVGRLWRDVLLRNAIDRLKGGGGWPLDLCPRSLVLKLKPLTPAPPLESFVDEVFDEAWNFSR